MQLTRAQITNSKSIHDSGPIEIAPEVAVIVGQNEAGERAFSQAVHETRPVADTVTCYDRIEENPGRFLTTYGERHQGDEFEVANMPPSQSGHMCDGSQRRVAPAGRRASRQGYGGRAEPPAAGPAWGSFTDATPMGLTPRPRFD